MLYRCKNCGRTFNADALSECCYCGEKVSRCPTCDAVVVEERGK